MGEISFYPGSPLPLGATQLSSDRYRFALFSSQATQVVLVLADKNFYTQEIVLSRKENRTGAIWHIEVEGISDLWSYAFRVDGPTSSLGRFDFKNILLILMQKPSFSTNFWVYKNSWRLCL